MWVTVLSEMLALAPSEIMVKGKIYLQACLFSNSVEPAQMFTINVNINLFSDSKKKEWLYGNKSTEQRISHAL